MSDSTFEKRKAQRIKNAKWFIWITLAMGGLMIFKLIAAVLRNGWEGDLPLMFLVFPVLTAMIAGCGYACLIIARKSKPPEPVAPRAESEMPKIATIELRTDEDRVIESRASQPLEWELEQVAERLCRLGHEYSDLGDAMWQQMQGIGRSLHEQGGLRLMQLVCNRTKQLGGRASSVTKS